MGAFIALFPKPFGVIFFVKLAVAVIRAKKVCQQNFEEKVTKIAHFFKPLLQLKKDR